MSDIKPSTNLLPTAAWVHASVLEGLARRTETSPDASYALREAGKLLIESEREIALVKRAAVTLLVPLMREQEAVCGPSVKDEEIPAMEKEARQNLETAITEARVHTHER